MVGGPATDQAPVEPAGLGWPHTVDPVVPRETSTDVTPAGLGWPQTPRPQAEMTAPESAS